MVQKKTDLFFPCKKQKQNYFERIQQQNNQIKCAINACINSYLGESVRFDQMYCLLYNKIKSFECRILIVNFVECTPKKEK